jgi:glyoxylase-like metal-dependent hydrolase (beta-lactamase superfamily II)
LETLEVKSGDIKYVAISHTHPDHIGNVELFPQAMLLVQKAEYDWPSADGTPRFKPSHPVTNNWLRVSPGHQICLKAAAKLDFSRCPRIG